MTDANIPEDDVPTTESKRAVRRDAVTGGFSRNTDLISYIVAGLVIGLAVDWMLSTSPIMVITWTLMGLGVGAYRLWQYSATLDEQGRERSHGV